VEQPVGSINKGPWQVFQVTAVVVVEDSGLDAYEYVDISEGDDIYESEETDPMVSERIRSGSSSDSSS
jgi:hypothetical protein